MADTTTIQRTSSLFQTPLDVFAPLLHTQQTHYTSQPTQKTDISPFEKMLSAISGAVMTSLLVTPLDVVKFRLQSQSAFAAGNSSATQGGKSTKGCVVSPHIYRRGAATGQNIMTCCHEVFFQTPEFNAKAVCRHFPRAYAQGGLVDRAQSFAQTCQKKAITPLISEVPKLERGSLQFKGTTDAVMKIVRHEGVLSLWHGLSPTLIMAIPATVIYFGGYDYFRDRLQKDAKCGTIFSALASGAIARTIAATAISPIELVRTRMQSSTGEQKSLKGVLDGLRLTVRERGLHTLWRGLGPTLWRDVPFSALYWVGYETSKQFLLGRYTHPSIPKQEQEFSSTYPPSGVSSPHTSSETTFPRLQFAAMKRFAAADSTLALTEFEIAFLSGATSGMVAATITTPFDVVKTRKQIDMKVQGIESADKAASVSSQPPKEPSSVKLFKEIWRTEGHRGLFRGLTARVAKVAPACAIMISSYEMGKSFFGARNATESSQTV